MLTRIQLGGCLLVVICLQLLVGWNYEIGTGSAEGKSSKERTRSKHEPVRQASAWWDICRYENTAKHVRPDLSPYGSVLTSGIRSVLSHSAALSSFEEQQPVVALNGAVSISKRRPIPFRVICSGVHREKCMLLKAGCENNFKIMKSTLAKPIRFQKLRTEKTVRSQHYESVIKSFDFDIIKPFVSQSVDDCCVLLPLLDFSGWDNTNWIGQLASKSLQKLLPMLSPHGWLSQRILATSYIGLAHMAWEVSDTLMTREKLYFDPSFMMLMRSNFEASHFVDWFDTSIPLIPQLLNTVNSTSEFTNSSRRDYLLLIQSKRISAFRELAKEQSVLVGKGGDVQKAIFCLVTRGSSFAIHSSFLLKAMAGGCIPVIANDASVLPLQGWANWTAFSILIREDNVPSVLLHLENVRNDAVLLATLQRNVFSAWKEMFQSPAHVIRECLLFWRWRVRIMMSWGEGR